MNLEQQDLWWKHAGGQELRRLLVEVWDPIGVKDLPEAADEYDGYRGRIVNLLRAGASAEQVSRLLAESEERMGLASDATRLLPIAQMLIAWFSDSVSRWEGPEQH